MLFNIKNIIPWFLSDIFDFTKYISTDSGAEVINGIYIGSLSTVSSRALMEKLNIKFIVNLSQRKYNSEIQSVFIDISDSEITIDNIEDYMTKLKFGSEIIKTARNENINVLVHCAAGINRSALLILIYLIDIGYDYHTALSLLKSANDTREEPVLTNSSFRRLAKTYYSFKINYKI